MRTVVSLFLSLSLLALFVSCDCNSRYDEQMKQLVETSKANGIALKKLQVKNDELRREIEVLKKKIERIEDFEEDEAFERMARGKKWTARDSSLARIMIESE